MNSPAALSIPMDVDETANYSKLSGPVSTAPSGFRHATAHVQQAIAAAVYATVRTHLAMRFRYLARQWLDETINMSLIEDMILHPAYQELIGMGPTAIPMLLDELERAPNHWFPALRAISGGQNPVADQDAGDLERMTAAWLNWGERNGYR